MLIKKYWQPLSQFLNCIFIIMCSFIRLNHKSMLPVQDIKLYFFHCAIKVIHTVFSKEVNRCITYSILVIHFRSYIEVAKRVNKCNPLQKKPPKLHDTDAKFGLSKIQGLFKDYIKFWLNSRTSRASSEAISFQGFHGCGNPDSLLHKHVKRVNINIEERSSEIDLPFALHLSMERTSDLIRFAVKDLSSRGCL